MRITKLVAENVKRLKHVEVNPGADDPMIVVGGFNGQGKSSLLDAIKYGLAGKASHPPRVIREGQREAWVEIETEELTVIRRWSADGENATTTELEIRAKDGTKLKSPQTILDRLYDELAFDALEFVALKPKEQLELLKKLVGVDTGPLDAERQKLFDARTVVNRDLSAAEARLKAMPAEKPPPAVDVAALQRQQSEAQALRDAALKTRRARDAAMQRTADAEQLVRNAEEAIARAKLQLEQAKAIVEERRKAAAELDNAVDDAEEAATGCDERIAALSEQMREASVLAAANARWEERERLASDVKRLTADADGKTAAIGTIDAEKNAMVSGARFPIEGLGFGVSGVLYKGLPFEQASQAEQLRVSVAVGAARKPKLRVMTVRDGSRLDKRGLKLLAEIAREREIQVWLEAVGEDGPATVIIRDGSAVDVASEAA